MVKILAACGAGINTSHQIKSAVEEEMKNRGYQVQVDTTVIKDITEAVSYTHLTLPTIYSV